MSNFRRDKIRHILPLTKLTVSELILTIDRMSLRKAKATLRAFSSLSTTNCGWYKLEIAKRFIGDVRRRINFLSERAKR